MKESSLVNFENYLIKGDSTKAFIHFYCRKKFIVRLCRFHLIEFVFYKLGFMSSSTFYRVLLQYVIQGMPKDHFERVTNEFAATCLDKYLHMPHIHEVLHLQHEGTNVEVQSTGLEEWVRPWCDKLHISSVKAYRAECDENGYLTGEILPPVSR